MGLYCFPWCCRLQPCLLAVRQGARDLQPYLVFGTWTPCAWQILPRKLLPGWLG